MNKKRLAAFGIGSLALLGISSFAMTLAWYSSGIYNAISPVQITLRSEPTFLISTSDKLETFKNSLSKNELKQVNEFSPVSSMYSDRWIAEKVNYPKFAGDFTHYDKGINPSYVTTGFFSQDLYFYSEDDIYVTFDKTKVSFTPNKELNAQEAKNLVGRFPELSEQEIFENLNAISKSLRVSILVPDETNYDYFIYDPLKSEETVFAGILDTNLDHYFDFNEETKKEIIYGQYEKQEKIVYQPGTSEDVPYSGTNTCFNAKHKAHIDQFDLDSSIVNGFEPAIENSLSQNEIEDEMKIRVENQKPTHFILSIYIEGWDLDNTNLVEYAAFNVDIQFKIKGDIL